MVPISDVHLGRIQLRPFRRNLEFYELRDSIEENSLMYPPVCRRVRERWEIIDGQYRWGACKDLGHTEIPIIERDVSDGQVELLQLQLNKIHREVSLSEYRIRINRVIAENGLDSLRDVGYVLSKNIDWVATVLGLDSLYDRARDFVDSGKVDIATASLLAKLTVPRQRQLLPLILTKQATIEDLRLEAKHGLETKHTNRAVRRHSLPDIRLRTKREVYDEVNIPTAAMKEITAAGATTPLDGWKLALRWVLHLIEKVE